MQLFGNDVCKAPCKSGPAWRKFRHRISIAMSGEWTCRTRQDEQDPPSFVFLISWRKPKVSAAYQRVLDPPPPGPPAHRLRAAVRARSADSDHAAVNDNAAGTSNGVASDQTLSAPQTEATR
jgi:hypothetical protein